MRPDKVQSRRHGRVVIISRPADALRLDQLEQKVNRTEAETLEFILLRLGRMEAAMQATEMRRRP